MTGVIDAFLAFAEAQTKTVFPRVATELVTQDELREAQKAVAVLGKQRHERVLKRHERDLEKQAEEHSRQMKDEQSARRAGEKQAQHMCEKHQREKKQLELKHEAELAALEEARLCHDRVMEDALAHEGIILDQYYTQELYRTVIICYCH